MGGQLMPEASVHSLIKGVHSGKISSWDEVHGFYAVKSKAYASDKLNHAIASLLEIKKLSPTRFSKKVFAQLLQDAVRTREWMVKGIYDSRAKDYSNPFRKMVYDTEKEMEKVLGKLSENSFIQQQQAELAAFREKINTITGALSG